MALRAIAAGGITAGPPPKDDDDEEELAGGAPKGSDPKLAKGSEEGAIAAGAGAMIGAAEGGGPPRLPNPLLELPLGAAGKP